MSKDWRPIQFRKFPGVICVFAGLLTACQLHSQDAAALGQQTFSACAACHGLDGRGGEHAPNIATEPSVQRMSNDALLAVVRNGIQAKGMPGFGKLLDDRRIHAVVQYLRVLQGGAAATNLPGNSEKGVQLFFGRAGCGDCHMVNGRGGFFAADLSGYGSHSPAEIRNSIVSPNVNLNPRHGTVTAVTQDARTYRGAIRNEDNFSLQMQTPDGQFHLFDKAQLTSIERESTTMMPADYASKLSNSELDDLVKFLSQGGGGKTSDAEDEPQ